MMSLPRELTLRATSSGIQLCQRIASECHEALTAVPHTIPPQAMLGVGQYSALTSLPPVSRGLLELTLTAGSRVALSLQQGDHQQLTLAAGEEDVALRYTRNGVNGQAASMTISPVAMQRAALMV